MRAVPVVLSLIAASGVAAYLVASRGPSSYRSVFERRLSDIESRPLPTDTLREGGLEALPEVVQRYVRGSGAVGKPRVHRMYVEMRGRIRAGAEKPWMPFTALQVSDVDSASRVFYMNARMFGLPVSVLHRYEGAHATMDGKVLSLVRVADGRGPEMDVAETVTILNDWCVMAPGALPFLPIVWQVLDSSRVRATYTRGAHTVSAELAFDEDARLVDFVSGDRYQMDTPDGVAVRRPWRTPMRDYQSFNGYRLASFAEARWVEPGGVDWSYGEFGIVRVVYNRGQRE